jgi:uncharacterized protein
MTKGEVSMQKLNTGAAYQFTPADDYNGNKLPVMLIVHGWGSAVFTGKVYFELALMLQSVGYHTMMLSLRGHQASSGDVTAVTREHHLADIDAAFAHLHYRTEVDNARICGFGASYGGYLLACKPLGFELLALRAPALYPNDGWDKPTADLIARPDRTTWRSTVRTPQECLALAGIRDFPGDVLVVGSEHDKDMPPQVLESYRGATRRYRSYYEHVIAGADHRLNEEQLAEFLRVNQTWFTEKYPQRR